MSTFSGENHTVIALTVERRRRDDAISEDPRLVKPAENLANFAAENQAVLVSVKRFLPQRTGLKNLLRQNDWMLRAGLLLFCRDTTFATESCAGMK